MFTIHVFVQEITRIMKKVRYGTNYGIFSNIYYLCYQYLIIWVKIPIILLSPTDYMVLY